MGTTASKRPSTDARAGGLVLAGLAIAYSPMYVTRLLSWAGIEWGPQGPPSALVWNWVAVGLLLAYVLRVEGQGLASIAFTRPSGRDVGWAVLFALAAIVVQIALTAITEPPPSEGLDTVLALSLPLLVALVVTTSITEEVLYRGYVIERLAAVTGRLWIGVAVSGVLFVIPHLLFFGPQWLVYNGASVALLYALYVWRRNLVACMTMHLVGNSFVLIPALGLG